MPATSLTGHLAQNKMLAFLGLLLRPHLVGLRLKPVKKMALTAYCLFRTLVLTTVCKNSLEAGAVLGLTSTTDSFK
jgi:hypothetical protein